MFKSTVNTVVLACVLVVVTSVGAVGLRLYCLACRARRHWGALVIHVRRRRSRPLGTGQATPRSPRAGESRR